MPHPLEQLREDALREIGDARDERALDAVRVRYLGRSGSISAWGGQMKTLGKEERPIVGKLLNEPRNAVPAAIEECAQKFRRLNHSHTLPLIPLALPLADRRGS